MTAAEARSYGRVFDGVATEYDRHRPTYPDELVDAACRRAGLSAGDRVLEIGCGTGQLTGSLLARGLRVTAVEPGERMIELAGAKLAGRPAEFVHARLEDAALPPAGFRAAFSAAAFHWPDPDVSWRIVAEALVPGGTFALIQHLGVGEERSAGDQRALLGALQRVAPQLAAEWPEYREAGRLLAGARERDANLSEVWAWLCERDLARPYAAELFEAVEVTGVTSLLEHTAAQLNALLGTMSWWARLGEEQRRALTAENEALELRLGRPIRSSVMVTVASARRR